MATTKNGSNGKAKRAGVRKSAVNKVGAKATAKKASRKSR